jgi:pimeloyl-ACP methyl ester carboxylesterase
MRGPPDACLGGPIISTAIEVMKRVTPFAVDPEPLATQLSQKPTDQILRLCMTDFSTATSLDPHEEHFRIPAPREDALLFLRYLPAEHTTFALRRAVLYVHGATFQSALSIAHRFDGRSWRDALGDAGFDVWGLDLYGFGHSDRYPEMDRPAAESPALCVADDAARQVEAAVRFILAHQNIGSISLIAHSWGSMPASLFAGEHPALVERLVLFAPIARRDSRRYEQPATFSGLADRDPRRSMGPICRGRAGARDSLCCRACISTSGASAI